MANKRQRKKNWKATHPYEGKQYRGGREEGRKNLKKVDGMLVNQHNVAFTPEQKKALETLVNSANRKRVRMLKEEAAMPMLIGGRETGDTVASLHVLGKESDFILRRKSKSLQRFKSMAEYENYMDNLRHVMRKDYLDERVKLYKRNHMAALKNEFGDDAKDVMMKIRMMKRKDYMKMVQKDEFLEIGFIYDPGDKTGRLNQIRAALGMKLKEDEIEDL